MAYMHCTWHNKSLLIRFQGKMTVEIAQKIKKGLLQLYDQKASAYYADFSHVTDIDVTFLQLLTAFNLKINNFNAKLYILRNKVDDQLLDNLKIIGIDLSKYFLIAEGSNDFTGK
jgi:anti-anti-sigma regulatory factor